jgi:site-specific DNA-cytosine methylase
LKVLVACEESQTVTIELRKLGHEAYSCDLEECSGGRPEWHIQGDALKEAYSGNYDMMIAHPPCTYLTVTGNKWMKPEFKDRFPDRPQQRLDAIDFFMKLYNAPIEKIAIENPVGIMSTQFRKPNQYVHPYFFGDKHSKKTGLWLRGLKLLVPTNIVEPEMYTYKDGRKDPMWHFESMKLPPKERSKYRSKTFPGIAKQLAFQWAGNINK